MKKVRYVIDTNGIISFFSEIFRCSPRYDNSPSISQNTINIIKEALSPQEGAVLLSVPSVIFIEIYEKWLSSEEFKSKFWYEVFTPLKQSPNIEIRAIDQEILENLLSVGGTLKQHDLHDKIVVAAAITLECSIITTDTKIMKFVKNEQNIVPSAFS